MKEFSHKLVTFFLNMVQAGGVSQVSLKRELDQLSKEIYDIDLKIQQLKQVGNLTHVPNLEAAKI